MSGVGALALMVLGEKDTDLSPRRHGDTEDSGARMHAKNADGAVNLLSFFCSSFFQLCGLGAAALRAIEMNQILRVSAVEGCSGASDFSRIASAPVQRLSLCGFFRASRSTAAVPDGNLDK
jgi:hypothetical protein